MLAVVGVVLRATFPSNDVVRLRLSIVEFDHELELEALVRGNLLDLVEWNLRYPQMAISPFHLHAAATTVLVWIPAAQEIGRPQQPQILSKRCLILDSQDQFLERKLTHTGTLVIGLSDV